MWTTRFRHWRSYLVTGRSVLGHRCRMSTMPTTAHVPPFHFFEVRIQLPVLATIKSHRIVPDAFGPEERVEQIKC